MGFNEILEYLSNSTMYKYVFMHESADLNNNSSNSEEQGRTGWVHIYEAEEKMLKKLFATPLKFSLFGNQLELPKIERNNCSSIGGGNRGRTSVCLGGWWWHVSLTCVEKRYINYEFISSKKKGNYYVNKKNDCQK